MPSSGKTHARLAPSAFKAYEACPSYLPDDEATKASERGDLLHLIMQGKLKEEKCDLEPGDHEQLKMVRGYVEMILDNNQVYKPKTYREYQIDLTPLHIPDCTHGTIDLLSLCPKIGCADLLDYKFGWIEVDDAEKNIQTGIYSLGVFAKFPKITQVNVHILQPARDEIGEAILRRDDPEVKAFLLRAKTIANRVIKFAGKEFNPTLDFCIWCDRKASCAKMHEFALKARDLAQIHIDEFGDLDARSFSDVEQSGDVYDFASAMERWAGAIKYNIVELAKLGHDIPGHDLREVSGKRSIISPHEAYEILKKKFKVTLPEFLEACEASVTKVLKAVGAKAPDRQKTVRKQEASNALMSEGVITQGNPSAYLVRAKPQGE